MEKEEKNKTEDSEIIKTIKEEYEKKIADLKKAHEEELAKIRKEEEEKSVRQIRALMSGNSFEDKSQKKPADDDKSFEEQLLIDTKKNFGI